MRKITKESVNAFLNREKFSKSNMSVTFENGYTYLRLFGNPIAALESNGELSISTCGWDTPTTKERLNALPNVRVNTKAGQLYLNGNRWDGRPVYVKQMLNKC
jgi:hypothetical protein